MTWVRRTVSWVPVGNGPCKAPPWASPVSGLGALAAAPLTTVAVSPVSWVSETVAPWGPPSAVAVPAWAAPGPHGLVEPGGGPRPRLPALQRTGLEAEHLAVERGDPHLHLRPHLGDLERQPGALGQRQGWCAR